MRLPRIAFPFAAIIAVVTLAQAAHANIMIIIDKSAQKMTVTVNGEDRYTWPVSTGRDGYDTPSGDFQPFRMEKDHFSREWDDAPMPNSIFFTKISYPRHLRSPQSRQARFAWLRPPFDAERGDPLCPRQGRRRIQHPREAGRRNSEIQRSRRKPRSRHHARVNPQLRLQPAPQSLWAELRHGRRRYR
jgi:hypothetical protein